jgi:hypothetical protein
VPVIVAECQVAGHMISDEGEGYACERCGAEQCPVCREWFPDYDALQDHLDPEEWCESQIN